MSGFLQSCPPTCTLAWACHVCRGQAKPRARAFQIVTTISLDIMATTITYHDGDGLHGMDQASCAATTGTACTDRVPCMALIHTHTHTSLDQSSWLPPSLLPLLCFRAAAARLADTSICATCVPRERATHRSPLDASWAMGCKTTSSPLLVFLDSCQVEEVRRQSCSNEAKRLKRVGELPLSDSRLLQDGKDSKQVANSQPITTFFLC